MSGRDFLTLADVLALHEVLIRRHGGSPGVRDLGALESAINRPQPGYCEDIVSEAAALFESLVINPPSSMATSASPFPPSMSFCASTAGNSSVHPAGL